jgi:alkyl hydroperoxide reductase subunit AhpC
MSILLLSSKPIATAELAHERVLSLRAWLDGCWAAVFSNPNDFAPAATTPPGFVTCLAHALTDAGIKPIAFNRSAEPSAHHSWFDHAIGDDSWVVLNNDGEDVIDLAEFALAAHLDCLHRPFVSIIDERGRVRVTVTYRPSQGTRSVLDVVELVSTLKTGLVTDVRELSALVG